LWNGPQVLNILEVNSSGVPAHDGIAATGVWQGTGTIERSVIVADPIIAYVPEPSIWTMMILGFLGVGFLAYRKKSTAPRLIGASMFPRLPFAGDIGFTGAIWLVGATHLALGK
jgi:hypothetical protein